MQCGYCTPGFEVTAKALLDRNPMPSGEEIKEALAGNLCRCGTYPQHVKAVKEAGWEPVVIDDWRGAKDAPDAGAHVEFGAQHWLIKFERMPDGRKKLFLKDKHTGAISQRVE